MGGKSNSKYNVFLPAYYGCKVIPVSGSSSPVHPGESFSFKVDLLASHSKSTLKVTANNVELSPSGNIYTISNIQADQIVRIEGVAFNTFIINATAGANGTITPSGEVHVNQGGIQSFSMNPDVGYSIDKIIVDGTNLGNLKSYRFQNVLETHSINATFKLGDLYNINTSASELSFETYTGIPTEPIEVIINSPDIISGINVTAPPRFQISDKGTKWYSSFNISRTQLPYKLYVRFYPGWGPINAGTFNEVLTLKSTDAYAEIKLIGLSHLGIDDTAQEQNIKIFPNPTTGKLRIENGELKIENIEIFDFLGKIVYSNNIFTSDTYQEIDIAHINAGIYIVSIQTEKGKVFQKVVKE
jgi:hypothetical protein